jgi:hypothetical protein
VEDRQAEETHAEDMHEWDADVLERTLKRATTRLGITVAVAVPAAIVGVVGLVMGGSGPIWGLAGLFVAAISLSFALRQKTKRDYCLGQLEEIERREKDRSAGRPGASV